jgi:hypothetical protein
MLRTAFITPVTEAVRNSETSDYFTETTWRHIPEGCHLDSRSREILKAKY